jgi:hypothetical protein
MGALAGFLEQVSGGTFDQVIFPIQPVCSTYVVVAGFQCFLSSVIWISFSLLLQCHIESSMFLFFNVQVAGENGPSIEIFG